MSTTLLRARIDAKLKKQSEDQLQKLGLDMAAFLSMSLRQLVNRRGLPFAVTESDEEYFANEYDLKPKEAAAAGARMKRESARARRNGALKAAMSPEDLAP